MQANHLENHIFTNNQGFHNHVAHHVLAAYSLGAGPKLLEQIYELENYGLVSLFDFASLCCCFLW